MLWSHHMVYKLLALLTLCSSLYAASPDLVSRTFIAKYLGKVSESEWEKRGSHGEVVTVYSNGVTVTQSYLEGKLHGRSTESFTHSDKCAKSSFFEEGHLVREVSYYATGLVKQEQLYHSPTARTTTYYREDGSMASIETFQGLNLQTGQYFDNNCKVTSSVVHGSGLRSYVDLMGKTNAVEQIEGGFILSRTTYYPNGGVKGRFSFKDNKLDGIAHHFLINGAPTCMEHWTNGRKNGTAVYFDNGEKIAEINFLDGKKEGLERHFKNETKLTEEIVWKEDVRHGPSTLFIEGEAHTQWYFEGKKVNKITFEMLDVTKGQRLKNQAASKKQ